MRRTDQILHVASKLDGYGMCRQLELLVANQLAAGQKVKVVALAARPDVVAVFEQFGAECRLLKRRWQSDPFAAARLAGELRRHTFDMLHLWGQDAVNYVRSIQRFVRHTPALATLPDQALLNSQPNIAVAPGIAEPSSPAKSRAQFLAEQRLPDNSILIAVAGPLTRSQRIDEAIWYFELVRTLEERVRLLIFGDGPDRHRLERFSRLTSEPSAIRFLGYRADFRELVAHADLFWHTAVADEALPLSVLEAMAAEVPVVANDGPGCRRIIEQGNNGYLAGDKDRAVFARHTRKLLGDERHAEQMGNHAAQTVVERFSVDAMTARYDDLYAKLMKN